MVTKPNWFNLKFKRLLFWSLLMVTGSVFHSIYTFDKIAEGKSVTKVCVMGIPPYIDM